MKSREKLVGIAVLAALAMNAAPAFAQAEEGRHEVHLYGGQSSATISPTGLFSGRVPKLDADFTYGVRYGYTVTRNFGLELSVGETATSATHLATRDSRWRSRTTTGSTIR